VATPGELAGEREQRLDVAHGAVGRHDDAHAVMLRGKASRCGVRTILSPARMSDEQAGSTTSAREPAELLEALITQCWTEVLGIESPDRNDDFFELGGDSLQGLELTDKVAQRLPFEAPLVALFFQDPTIRGFAGAIAAEVGAEELARLGAGGGAAASA
jgi:hypothetical protein